MIKITVYTVDGGMSSWEENESIIDELHRLEDMEYKGKYLLYTLITDDWGVPPTSVIFEGIYKDKKFKKSISYE